MVCKCGDNHWRSIAENEKVSCGHSISHYCMGCGKIQAMMVVRLGYLKDDELRKIFILKMKGDEYE